MRNKLEGVDARRAAAAVFVVAATLAGPGAATATAASDATQRARISSAPFRATSPAAVPAAFRATAITWVSGKRAMVLGSAPCTPSRRSTRPFSGSQPGPTCSYVVGTADGGSSWNLLGSVPAKLATAGEPGQGITQIRFANPQIGWAYGPLLLRTTDGGRTWTRMPIPGSGHQIVQLAADRRGAYAVVSPCRWAEADACLTRPYTFWRNSSLTGTWTRIRLDVAPPKRMFDFAAGIAVYGTTVYALRSVSDITGTIFQDKLFASTDGVHFSARPDPCNNAAGLSLSQVVPTSATGVALLCQGAPHLGSAEKQVYRSTNTGRTDQSAGIPSTSGIDAQLAASPSGNLAIASTSGASFLGINDSGKRRWLVVAEVPDGGLGWNDIVFATNTVVWVVYAPAADSYPLAPGQLFVSRDGGRHWSVAAW